MPCTASGALCVAWMAHSWDVDCTHMCAIALKGRTGLASSRLCPLSHRPHTHLRLALIQRCVPGTEGCQSATLCQPSKKPTPRKPGPASPCPSSSSSRCRSQFPVSRLNTCAPQGMPCLSCRTVQLQSGAAHGSSTSHASCVWHPARTVASQQALADASMHGRQCPDAHRWTDRVSPLQHGLMKGCWTLSCRQPALDGAR